MNEPHSLFHDAPDIVPPGLSRGMTVADLVDLYAAISFEARQVARGAALFRRMVAEGDTIWLGIAGAGIAGGMGCLVRDLIEAGFVDVVCSTGAQVYHDLHFAFGLPVKAIHPRQDDDRLRRHGDTRIYDVGIRKAETLEAQDEIIRRFVRECHGDLAPGPISSAEFTRRLGAWTAREAPHPERSFVVAAAERDVPVFWDSLSNHSIAMNLVRTERDGLPVVLSPTADIFDSAAIAFDAGATGFVELGGGGPKNFIQQTGPTISQILGGDFEGADRGLQIGTAPEREGSLSGCTFGEAVTWGKYRAADAERLVQIAGDYTVIFPILAACVFDRCEAGPPRRIAARMPELRARLEAARGHSCR